MRTTITCFLFGLLIVCSCLRILLSMGNVSTADHLLRPPYEMQVLLAGTVAAWMTVISGGILVFRATTSLAPRYRVIVRSLFTTASIFLAVVAIPLGALILAIGIGGRAIAIGDVEYVPTTSGYPQTCYHRTEGPFMMEATCNPEIVPHPKVPSSLPEEPTQANSSPLLHPTQPTSGVETPQVGQTWTGLVDPQTIVAQKGDVAVFQVDTSLGEKGRFVTAVRQGDLWGSATLVGDGVSSVDFVDAGGILVAAFSPDPHLNVMLSDDGGHTWARLDVRDDAVNEDMRFFHRLEKTPDGLVLTAGYPSWVLASEEISWESADGVSWSGPY